MNFYFNYFLFVGREGIFNCQRQRQHSCVLSFPEKVDFTTEFVYSFLEKLTLPPRSVKKKLKHVAECCIFQINVVSLYSYNAMVCGESMLSPEDVDNQIIIKHIIL